MFYILFLLYIKNEWKNLLSKKKNRKVILNRTKDYYENDKERLGEQARYKYRNLSEKEKNKKREYGRNRDHNMSKKKTKTKRISKNYCEAKKSQFNNQYMIW